MNSGVEFYYLRNNANDGQTVKGHPCGVVAVCKNSDGSVNRGISLCSYVDTFDKKIGRNIAYNRLMKALDVKQSIGPFKFYYGNKELRPNNGFVKDSEDRCKLKINTNDNIWFYSYRSEYHVNMNSIEENMFK